jgi:glucose/arabinose dehydrogenase
MRRISGILSMLGIIILILTGCSQGTTLPVSQPTLSSTATATQTNPLPTPSQTATIIQPTVTTVPTPTVVPSETPNITSYTWKTVVKGLNDPVGITNAGDGSGRLFVLEKPGRVRVVKNDQLLPVPFLDIRNLVKSSGSEQGLVGIAFDPDYVNNGLFYVDYTDSNNRVVIARFKVSGNPDQADPASEEQILVIPKPYTNHNGGQLAFGPDGYLYIGVGDGGSEGDPHNNGQSVNTLLGKILRIDVHSGSPYTIPKDNPFINGGGLPEIWAYGLRNPWRFDFDPATGNLYIGDVGQDTWEEVDFVQAGYQGPALNFGWSCREGLHAYKGCSPPAGAAFTDPVWEYDHSLGCAIIGGVVYRGKDLPGLDGTFLAGDYCSGNIWGLSDANGQGWQGQLLYQIGLRITSFGRDESGEVYLSDQNGSLYELVN